MSQDSLLSTACELAEAGRWDAALEAFDAAVDAHPGLASGHEQRAQVLLELGRAAEAAEAAERAVALQPGWADALLTLGRARLNSGSFGEAIVALQRAAALDPSLESEVGDDLERARSLELRSDEAELKMHNGVALRLQQWRGSAPDADHGPCDGCGAPRASGAADAERPTRHGTGTMIWECGIVLAKLLDRLAAGDVPADSPAHAAFPRRARAGAGEPPGSGLDGLGIVELGSGTGVAGLAAAALGARVLLTDVAEVVPLVAANVAANAGAIGGGGGAAQAQAYDWHAPQLLPPGSAEPWDVVLAADALYQPGRAQLDAFAAALAAWIRSRPESAAGARLLLAHKARTAALDAAIAPMLLERAGLTLCEVPFEHHHPDFRSPQIKVYVGTARHGRA